MISLRDRLRQRAGTGGGAFAFNTPAPSPAPTHSSPMPAPQMPPQHSGPMPLPSNPIPMQAPVPPPVNTADQTLNFGFEMPGQTGLLAQQLQEGFGGLLGDWERQVQGPLRPMTSQVYDNPKQMAPPRVTPTRPDNIPWIGPGARTRTYNGIAPGDPGSLLAMMRERAGR